MVPRLEVCVQVQLLSAPGPQNACTHTGENATFLEEQPRLQEKIEHATQQASVQHKLFEMKLLTADLHCLQTM